MMKRIVQDWPTVAGYVIDKAECHMSQLDCMSLGVVDDDDDVLGGVIFHNYTGVGGSVTVHMAGSGRTWANREFLWRVFDYAFGQLFVRKIIGTVPSDNPKALDVDLRLGFTIEAVVRDAYPEADTLIVTMERDQCKWLDYTPKTAVSGFANLFRALTPDGG